MNDPCGCTRCSSRRASSSSSLTTRICLAPCAPVGSVGTTVRSKRMAPSTLFRRTTCQTVPHQEGDALARTKIPLSGRLLSFSSAPLLDTSHTERSSLDGTVVYSMEDPPSSRNSSLVGSVVYSMEGPPSSHTRGHLEGFTTAHPYVCRSGCGRPLAVLAQTEHALALIDGRGHCTSRQDRNPGFTRAGVFARAGSLSCGIEVSPAAHQRSLRVPVDCRCGTL